MKEVYRTDWPVFDVSLECKAQQDDYYLKD